MQLRKEDYIQSPESCTLGFLFLSETRTDAEGRVPVSGILRQTPLAGSVSHNARIVMSNFDLTQKIGKKLVFCRYIRKNGKVYFPRKRKVFCFWVER